LRSKSSPVPLHMRCVPLECIAFWDSRASARPGSYISPKQMGHWNSPDFRVIGNSHLPDRMDLCWPSLLTAFTGGLGGYSTALHPCLGQKLLRHGLTITIIVKSPLSIAREWTTVLRGQPCYVWWK